MKRLITGIAILALSLTLAGCTQPSGGTKKLGSTEKPAASSKVDEKTGDAATTATSHTTMKPVTPPADEK